MLWIILISLIIVIIIYIYIQLQAPNLEKYIEKYNNHLNWTLPDDLFKNAKNGDLLFMAGSSRGEKTCCWSTNSVFSHVGMLFREIHSETGENIIYIWESDLGQKTKDGPRILTLKKKLKYYRGYRYLMWKPLQVNEMLRPSTLDIMKIVDKYKNEDFDNYMLAWWISEYFNMNKDGYFCSELIALTMQELGIMEKIHIPSFYSPKSFEDDKIEGLRDDFSYNIKKFIKF
jgi:hypothetical protein